MFTPISIALHRDNIARIDVTNHWQTSTLDAALKAAAPPIQSWEQLANAMPTRCANLTFAADSFESLHGHPFVNSAAQRIAELLEILDTFKGCFDGQGHRTAEGQRIYQNYFVGEKAWFTDSSDSEKNEFKAELTFKHPDKNTEHLFCTWHGKINTPKMRVHFSWPVSADERLCVVYIGQKLTKK